MATEVYRQSITDVREGDKITVSAMRSENKGVVSVAIQRGGFGATFTIGVESARSLSNRLNEAAASAASPNEAEYLAQEKL